MQAQMQQLQQKNENLEKAGFAMKNSLNAMGRREGNDIATAGPVKDARAGGGNETTAAMVSAARNTLGIPTGADLPT